ncbi:MAG: ferredoxin--NADP reductase [Alphaproteobacteria bacterium]|nr:ferredoxin--NADP reductase [Alphaproteobacteria bacterium]
MQYNAVVSAMEEITPDIRLFKIKLASGVKLPYKAGQFAILGLPADPSNLGGEWIRRAYSIASAPRETDVAGEVEFYIVKVENGQLTSRLFNTNAGDKIFMGEKVAGFMNLDRLPDDHNVLFICTGTGIAPFVSMMREYKEKLLNGKRKVGFLHGSRQTYELGYRDYLEALAVANPDFKYFPIVSRAKNEPAGAWSGYEGHAQSLIVNGEVDKVLGIEIKPADASIFLCGNPRMVDDTVAILTEKGFTPNTMQSPGNLYFDKH